MLHEIYIRKEPVRTQELEKILGKRRQEVYKIGNDLVSMGFVRKSSIIKNKNDGTPSKKKLTIWYVKPTKIEQTKIYLNKHFNEEIEDVQQDTIN